MKYKVVYISILLFALSCTSNVDNPKHVHFVFLKISKEMLLSLKVKTVDKEVIQFISDIM